MSRHDTFAHIEAGGFGLKALGCPACEQGFTSGLRMCPDCGDHLDDEDWRPDDPVCVMCMKARPRG